MTFGLAGKGCARGSQVVGWPLWAQKRPSLRAQLRRHDPKSVRRGAATDLGAEVCHHSCINLIHDPLISSGHHPRRYEAILEGTKMIERILRRPDVEQMTGLSRSTIYAMKSEGNFPRPLRLGKRAVGWPANQIEEWL